MSVTAAQLSRLIDTLDPESESFLTATDLYVRLLEQEALQGAAESSARIAAQHAEIAAQAAAQQQPSTRIRKLAAELEAAALTPGKYSDEQREALISRLNAEIREASRAALGASDKPSSVDVGALRTELEAAARLAARRGLDGAEADQLIGRFNAALPQGNPSSYATADLQAALAGQDQVLRFTAAAELERRGLLGEGVASQLVAEVNSAVREVEAAGPLDLEQVPEELRELAADMLAQAERDEQERRPQDPHDALVSRYNQAMRQAAEQARERDRAGVATGAPSEPTEET